MTTESQPRKQDAQQIAVSREAQDAAELEISANHLRALRECHAPIGTFVQKAINQALENYRNATNPR